MEETTEHLFQGIAASPGIGYGAVYIHDSRRFPIRRYAISDDQVEGELARFEEAVGKTRLQLQDTSRMVAARIDKTHSAIFDAQQVLLDDPLLIGACRDEIRSRKFNAESILEDVVERVRAVFQEISSPLFSLKTNDLVDVASRIRENLCPESTRGILDLNRDVVLAAHDLRPSDTARLDTKRVLAIVTEAGGPTSHSAILAKALKIPAVVGADGVLKHLKQDDSVIVDGYTGRVTLSPSGVDIERLRKRQKLLKRQSESLKMLRDLPCETLDGYSVDLAMNMEFPSEVGGVKETGAQGIGLFRSEFFYIGRGYIPPEEEQFQVYREVAEQVAPQPVICRTLDLGGDKFLSSSGVDNWEINPFLGLRAIRLCLANPDMFRSQLRAILRASAYGNIQIMFPFITDISEVRRSRALLDEIRAELDEKGIAYDRNLQVGTMIETPAAALTAPMLAKEVDFFSIGTNDLIQYTTAVDRVNESVAYLYNPLHPAVIQLIRFTIDSAHKAGIWVGVCGEMAADPAMAVLLLGMGVDELSMSAVVVPEVKRVIRSLTLDDVRKLRQQVLANLETDKAAEILAEFRARYVRTGEENESDES